MLHVRFALALAVGLLTLPAGGRQADAAPVTLGEVTSSVSRPNLDVQDALRRLATSELGRVDLRGARRGHWVLSVTLLRMETRLEERRARTTCVVSAMLRSERGGELHAILGGRAELEDAPRSVRALELGALRVAVHGAVGRVPDALR